MARPNYEEQFKQKLQDRELKPSADSWEKLSGRMEQEGEKKTNSQYKWWMGIAAAFVAGILVMNFFFNAPAGQDTPAYVEETKEMKEDGVKTRADESLLPETGEGMQYVFQEENMDNNTPVEKLEATQKASAGEEEMEPVLDSEEVQYASAGKESKSPESERRNSGLNKMNESSSENGSKLNPGGISETKSAVAEAAGREVQQKRTEERRGAGEKSLFTELAIDEELLSQKLREVVAEANVMEAAAGEVSDAEINALLLAASAEIEREQEVVSEELSADALLYEVEMELEESFRAKVFELLKEGFRKTRTAVANIND